MKNAFAYKKSFYNIILLVILILAMIFAYSSSGVFKSLNKTKQLTETNYNVKGLTETLLRDTLKMRMGMEANKEVILSYLPSFESNESIIQKTELDHINLMQYNKWFLFQFLFFILLYLYEFLEYVKEWIIQISQSRFDFFVVRFVELKDGKKDALSNSHSF